MKEKSGDRKRQKCKHKQTRRGGWSGRTGGGGWGGRGRGRGGNERVEGWVPQVAHSPRLLAPLCFINMP